MRAQGEAIGHVTTSEYGSQMLSLGGVHHLTGGSKKEGRVTCDALMDLSNCKPVELSIDGGATVVVQAGYPPIVNGLAEERDVYKRQGLGFEGDDAPSLLDDRRPGEDVYKRQA